jgi:hypothetical protein
MTSMFASAADLMARALGAERFPYVVIEHPISSAPPAALAERACRAAAQSAALLRGLPG